jgi:hypothetical protein
MTIDNEMGDVPFRELQEIIRLAGYKVISIGAEYSKDGGGIRFTGAIGLKIVPVKQLDQTDFVRFPQLSQDFLANCREYAAQSHQQGNGNCQE